MKSRKKIRETTRSEMRALKGGDTFIINGKEHIAAGDSHISGDSTFNGYVVYDKEGEAYFDTDFPENREVVVVIEDGMVREVYSNDTEIDVRIIDLDEQGDYFQDALQSELKEVQDNKEFTLVW